MREASLYLQSVESIRANSRRFSPSNATSSLDRRLFFSLKWEGVREEEEGEKRRGVIPYFFRAQQSHGRDRTKFGRSTWK